MLNKYLDKCASTHFTGEGFVISEQIEKTAFGIEGQYSENALIYKVPVWKENAIILLDPSDILYITMNKKKVAVHTREGWYESGSTLDELEQLLSFRGFFRSHKSFIVNMNHVEKIIPWYNSTYLMKLKADAEQIPVSRSYIKRLRELLSI